MQHVSADTFGKFQIEIWILGGDVIDASLPNQLRVLLKQRRIHRAYDGGLRVTRVIDDRHWYSLDSARLRCAVNVVVSSNPS
jgi:hypothetical protein